MRVKKREKIGKTKAIRFLFANANGSIDWNEKREGESEEDYLCKWMKLFDDKIEKRRNGARNTLFMHMAVRKDRKECWLFVIHGMFLHFSNWEEDKKDSFIYGQRTK